MIHFGRRRVATVVLVTCLAAATAACGSSAGSGAAAGSGSAGPSRTGSSAPASAPVSPSPSPPLVLPRSGRPLPLAALEAALPRPKGVGPGWRSDPERASTSDDDDPVTWAYVPARCAAFDDLRLGRAAGTRTARAAADFAAGKYFPDLGVTVISFDRPIDPRLVADARAALARCARYKVVEGDRSQRWDTRPLRTARLGTASLAWRETFWLGSDLPVNIDRLVVVSGHNLVSVEEAGLEGPADRALMVRVATKVLARLAAA